MSRKQTRTKGWTVLISGIVVVSALLFYWHIAEHSVRNTRGTAATSTTSPSIAEVPGSSPNTVPTVETPPATPEEVPQVEDTNADPEEVAKALNFLETLEEQNSPENNATRQGETTDNAPELTQDEMFQLIREGISYYDSLLESGSVDFFLQRSSVDDSDGLSPVNGTWEGTFEFSGRRVNGAVARNTTQSHEKYGNISRTGTTQFAYDGETYEVLRETTNGTRMTRKSDIGYDITYDPRLWGWDLSGEESLATRLDQINVKSITLEDWDGEQVYHVNGNVEDLTVDWWLNPKKSYRPERVMSSTSGNEGTRHLIQDFDFQEVAPDLWFPKSGQFVTTVTDAATGVETDVSTITMHLTNVRINEPVPAHRFALDPPSGTNVYDSRTRESFTVE